MKEEITKKGIILSLSGIILLIAAIIGVKAYKEKKIKEKEAGKTKVDSNKTEDIERDIDIDTQNITKSSSSATDSNYIIKSVNIAYKSSDKDIPLYITNAVNFIKKILSNNRIKDNRISFEKNMSDDSFKYIKSGLKNIKYKEELDLIDDLAKKDINYYGSLMLAMINNPKLKKIVMSLKNKEDITIDDLNKDEYDRPYDFKGRVKGDKLVWRIFSITLRKKK